VEAVVTRARMRFHTIAPQATYPPFKIFRLHLEMLRSVTVAYPRDGFCCRTPVPLESWTALTAFFPVSRCTIFCLNATEYGLVILTSRTQGFNGCDTYSDTEGRNTPLPIRPERTLGYWWAV